MTDPNLILEQRLRRIEDRLNALELVVLPEVEPAAPAPTPPPPPAPTATPKTVAATTTDRAAWLERPERTPAPIPHRLREHEPEPVPEKHVKKAKRDQRELERFFGVAVLGRIGVAAVLLAAAYFAQLAYREMSEVFKVASIYGLSAAFVGAGFVLRSRVEKKYVALLWGGGAAAAYLAGVTARLAYGLVDPYTAMAMLFGASVLGQWLAKKLEHPALASTALAGAFAAPLLVGDASDHRTLLMAYLLLLHGWSAYAERVFGWTSARIVGIAGTLAVAGVWVANHAALDASTFLHINGYLVGLVLPELIAIWRGESVDKTRTTLALTGVAAIEGLLYTWTLTGSELALPGFGWITGAVWLGVGLLLLTPPRDRDATLARGLVTIGGLLVTIGCFGAPQVLNVTGDAAQVWTAATLALSALGLLALRRVAGVGDAGASVAAALCMMAAIAGRDATTALWLVPVSLLPASALLFTGRSSMARITGLLAGGFALLGGLARGETFHVTWLAAGIAAAAAWLGLGLGVGAKQESKPVIITAALAFIGLGLVWISIALQGSFAEVQLPVLDQATWAAAGITLVAGFFALRFRGESEEVGALLWITALGVSLVAGAREVHHLVRDLALPARDLAYVAYAALAGLGVLWLGTNRRLVGVQATGALLVIGAAFRALSTGGLPDVSAYWAAEIAVATGATVVMSRLVGRGHEMFRVGVLAAYTLVAAAWALHALNGNIPADMPVWNLRFATGLAVLGAGFAIGWMRLGVEGLRSTYLLSVGALLGYLVGLAEVLDGAAYWELQEAWPDVLVSVYTTLYAAGLLAAGFLLHERRLRYPALAGFIGVVVKVGVHDLAEATLPLRILATGVLGLVLLAAAFAYARRKEGDRKTPDDHSVGETPKAA